MLPSELRTDIESLLLTLDQNQPLFDGLGLFRDYASSQMPFLERLGESAAANSAGELHTNFVNASQLLPQIKARSFFRAIENVRAGIARYVGSMPERSLHLGQVIEELDQFSEMFEGYISKPSGKVAAKLLWTATELLGDLSNARASLQSTQAQLQGDAALYGNEEVLSFYWSGPQTLPHLEFELKNLHELLLLIQSFAEDPVLQPPRILRIESGSFSIDLAVDKWLARAAKALVGPIAAWWYRNRTSEGLRRHWAPETKEMVKQVFDVRKMLVAAGIPTDKGDAELQEIYLQMVLRVGAITSDSISMKVNGVEYSEQAEAPPRLPAVRQEKLPYSHPPALPDESSK